MSGLAARFRILHWGRTAACLLAVTALPACAIGQEWTSRSEYDIVLGLRSEALPAKRLTILDAWAAAFPVSELRQARQQLYLATNIRLGNASGILNAARDILSERPNDFAGLYWIAVALPGAQENSDEWLGIGEDAAKRLLAQLNAYFASDKRPNSITEESWRLQKAQTEALGHRALGWIMWQRGQYSDAEAHLGECLSANSQNAEISLWLGALLAGQAQPARRSESLWHLARAAALKGEYALPEAQRRQVMTHLERLYVAHHGAPEGLDQLLQTSALSPDAKPRSDFRIITAAEIAERLEEDELARNDPRLFRWKQIRKSLERTEGAAAYFQTLSQSKLPVLRGTVLRCETDGRGTELALGVSSSTAEEVVLRFEPAISPQAPGTEVEFQGTATSYTSVPFRLVVSVKQDEVRGLAAPVRVSPRKKR